MSDKKIFNDPVHGFVTFDFKLIYELIDHPWFQRLRRISQMGLSHYVYPGAVHTRFHHSLGALHLMKRSLDILISKGVKINEEEKRAAQVAILLHDIGHGPYSHALEFRIIPVHHEQITLKIMEALNVEFKGKLSLAIEIFTDRYHRPFLNQLVSSQIDVDRLDYLSRDSFYTGVQEGFIGYNRIINMFNVVDDHLVVEEKALYTLERYIHSRKFMYAQVYLHKASLAAELMLRSYFRRLHDLIREDSQVIHKLRDNFRDLFKLVSSSKLKEREFESFLSLDDSDIISLLKKSVLSSDFVLRYLSKSILNRNLFRINWIEDKLEKKKIKELRNNLDKRWNLDSDTAKYLVIYGVEKIKNYDKNEKEILVLKKDGEILPLSSFYKGFYLKKYFKKHYLCSPKI